jgi:hypothetical protein
VQGLDKIECVEISLSDKPVWYKEKVYPVGKVSTAVSLISFLLFRDLYPIKLPLQI